MNVKGHLHEGRGICQNECARKGTLREGAGDAAGVPLPSLCITSVLTNLLFVNSNGKSDFRVATVALQNKTTVR